MLHVSRLVWVALPGLLAGCCCAGVVSGLVGRLLLDGGTPMAPLKADGGGAHHVTDLRPSADKEYSSGDSRLYIGN
jgi:hypothetical protein